MSNVNIDSAVSGAQEVINGLGNLVGALGGNTNAIPGAVTTISQIATLVGSIITSIQNVTGDTVAVPTLEKLKEQQAKLHEFEALPVRD